jgi:hypothetical protein
VLLTEHFVDNAPHVGPQVPAGHTWVVRDISWAGNGGSGDYVALYDDADAYFFQAGLAEQNSQGQAYWHGRQVLEAGDHLNYVGTTGQGVRVCGYDLTN